MNFSFFGHTVRRAGIGISRVGSLRFPEIGIRQMGKMYPVRLTIVSQETASHLAVPTWDQVREESWRVCFKEIKNPMQFSEEHGTFGVVFEEKENEIQKTSMQGRSSVCPWGETMDFFWDSVYKGKGRLCLGSWNIFGSLSRKETLWKLKKGNGWEQKTSRQINSKSVNGYRT